MRDENAPAFFPLDGSRCGAGRVDTPRYEITRRHRRDERNRVLPRARDGRSQLPGTLTERFVRIEIRDELVRPEQAVEPSSVFERRRVMALEHIENHGKNAGKRLRANRPV